jgi:hypothetical protein
MGETFLAADMHIELFPENRNGREHCGDLELAIRVCWHRKESSGGLS